MTEDQQPDTTSKRSRREANELFGEVEKDVKGYEGRCLFVTKDDGSCCDEPVSNNCHIVSEKAVLKGLEDPETKRVLELQWGISQWRQLAFSGEISQRFHDPTTFAPADVTTHDACVGRFACKQPDDHDGEFQPIDVEEADFDDPVVRFLAGYRLVLFLADQYRKAIWLQGRWNQKMQESLNREARRVSERRNRGLRRFTKQLKQELERAESAATLLGKHWYVRRKTGTFDPGLVSAKVVLFRSRLSLAGGVFYGSHTAVTVFPTQQDWHKMGVLYLTSDSGSIGQDLKCLTKVARASKESDNYGVTVISELMRKGWGTLAVSAQSYERIGRSRPQYHNGPHCQTHSVSGTGETHYPATVCEQASAEVNTTAVSMHFAGDRPLPIRPLEGIGRSNRAARPPPYADRLRQLSRSSASISRSACSAKVVRSQRATMTCAVTDFVSPGAMSPNQS